MTTCVSGRSRVGGGCYVGVNPRGRSMDRHRGGSARFSLICPFTHYPSGVEQTTPPAREAGTTAVRAQPATFSPPMPGGTVQAEQPRRKRGRPRDPEVDGRILNAAAELILERGYEAMTVDEVAVRARVGKATVYRRWARKEDLAVAAMEQLYTAEIPLPDTGSLHDDLVLVYTNLLTFANSPLGREYLRITIAESLRDHRISRLYQTAAVTVEAQAGAIFKRAIERGEIGAGTAVTWSMQWVLGLVLIAVVSDRAMPVPDDAEQLASMVLRGIAVR